MLSTVIHLIKRFSRLTFRPIFKIPRTVAGQMSLTYHKLWLHVKTFVLFHSFSHWRIWPNIRISLSCYLKDMWAYTKTQGPGQSQILYHNILNPILRQFSITHVMPHFRQLAYVLRYFFSEIGENRKNVLCCQSTERNAKE